MSGLCWPLGSASWCTPGNQNPGGSAARQCEGCSFSRLKWCSSTEAPKNAQPAVPYTWLTCMAFVLIALLLATMHYRMRDGKRRTATGRQLAMRRHRTESGARSIIPCNQDCPRRECASRDSSGDGIMSQTPLEPPSEPSPPKTCPSHHHMSISGKTSSVKHGRQQRLSRDSSLIDITTQATEENVMAMSEGSAQMTVKRSHPTERQSMKKPLVFHLGPPARAERHKDLDGKNRNAYWYPTSSSEQFEVDHAEMRKLQEPLTLWTQTESHHHNKERHHLPMHPPVYRNV